MHSTMQNREILKVGGNINIQRTDGRIHTAFIASINYEIHSATVEWFEGGETKGKEIDFLAIQMLNPHIYTPLVDPQESVVPTARVQPSAAHPPPPAVHPPIPYEEIDEDPVVAAAPVVAQPMTVQATPVAQAPPAVPTTGAHKIQRETSGSSEEENSGVIMVESGRFSQKLDESDDDFTSNQQSPDTTTLSNPTRQLMGGSAQTKPTNGSIHSSRGVSLIPQNTNNGHVDHSFLYQTQTARETLNQVTTSRSNNAIAQPQNTRRSNVVREVEKLKKNREERRQRQAEEKAEKEAFLQMAPGNPHWELSNMINEYRRTLDMRPLNENDSIEDHQITVCVRKRPVNKRELGRKEVDVITIPSKNQLVVHEPKNKVDLTKYMENQLFRFDYAFDESCTNAIVYKYTAQPLVKTIFERGFSTCFAYGQTGSGKTHTMGGDFNGKNQDCQKGIYALAAADVFKLNASSKYRNLHLSVCTSFFEIYSGKVFDLLNAKAKLRILEDGKQQVQVVGLTERVVTCVDDVLKIIQKGNAARTSGQTSANTNSSRSHAIFQIILRQNFISGAHNNSVYGKFSLIDLAGNERGADTSSANRQTRMEGAEINKSLLALKECIRALGRKGAHLPFRVSKLTQVLRDSFVGNNARTCMIAMISPGVSSCEHSLNTLRYADRVKELGGGDLHTAPEDANADDDGAKMQEGDLSELSSLHEPEMTPELIYLHQAMSDLQVSEDDMVENQKTLLETLTKARETAKKLLQMSGLVVYDQEDYCTGWDQLLDSTIDALKVAKEFVADYRAKLAAEEQISRKNAKK